MAKDKDIDLDAILIELGHMGKYQRKMFGFLMVIVLCNASNNNQYVFSAAPVNYRCKVPACETTPPKYATGPWAQFALPADNMCHRYKVIGPTCEPSSFSREIEECHSWVYEDDYSISTEFDLACQEWKRTLVGTIRSLAYFCTLPIVTFLSDTFGRRKILIFTAISPSLVGIARSFSTNYYMFLALEFTDAFVGCGAYSTVFILALEMVNLQTRVLGGCIISCTYAVGQSILGSVAWLVPYWRYRTRIIYTPAAFFISYIFIVKESIRWLITKERFQEAAVIILEIAEVNETDLHVNTWEKLQYFAMGESDGMSDKPRRRTADAKTTTVTQTPPPEEMPMIKQILKSKVITCRMIVVSFWWITVTMVYYGLTINSVSLSGNRYANYILTALIEIPGYLTVTVTLDYFGRKICIMAAFLTCGVSLLAIGTTKNHTTVLTLAMVGKYCISIVFCAIYIYSVELFPTKARHMMMGICSMVGRCGSMIAPQTPLLRKYMASLPYIIFGSMGCIAAVLMLFTPETLKMTLPDTIEEAENMGLMPHTSKVRTDILRKNEAENVNM